MKPLLSQCLIGYRFGKINVDKDYFLCCGTPPIGNYDKDGGFKEFWNSKKYDDLRHELKYNLEKQNEKWNGDCFECPHYSMEKAVSRNLENTDEKLWGMLSDERREGMLNDKILVGPREFQFEVSNPCNHRCNFCWNWSYDMLENNAQRGDFKEWSKQTFDLETYIDIVDDLKELGGCEEIAISGGGEPFIIKDIMKMIEHTKKLDFKLKIFTNFSRVNHDDMDNFIKWGVDNFEVNISAGTKKTYCKVRKLKSKDWDILIDNLTYLKENRKTKEPKINYTVIVTKDNIDEVDEIFEMAIKLGCYFIDFRDLVSHGVYNGQKLLPTENQMEVFNEKFFTNIDRYDFKEIKNKHYFYSEKLDMGVFNESFSYRR